MEQGRWEVAAALCVLRVREKEKSWENTRGRGVCGGVVSLLYREQTRKCYPGEAKGSTVRQTQPALEM